MLEQFCAFLVDQGKAENTLSSYRQAVGDYMKWYEATFGEPMEQLYRINVLDYISYLRTVKKLSNRSINAKLSALQSFNLYLNEAGVQTDTVVSERDHLKVQIAYANPSTISRDQVEAFRQRLLVGSGTRDYAIATILAYAGLRISECLDLYPEDVSLTAKEITIRHGKNGKSRVVFIGDKVVNAVREYLKERPDTGSPYLFISRMGDQLTRGQVNRIFNKYSKTIKPHSLRHFFCSEAIAVGGYSIDEVANQAGHSNVHTTLLYTNPTRERMKEKANRL